MEFRYRAGDLPGGSSRHEPSPFAAAMPHSAIRGVPPSVQLMTDEILHQELEKARVWQEILAEEIERRKEVMRAELRRQMIGERDPEPAISHVAVDGGVGRPTYPVRPPERRFIIPSPKPTTPEVRPPSASVAEPNKAGKLPDWIRDLGQENENSDLGGGKHEESEAGEKPKEDLRCVVCQVSATSHKQMIEHLAGKQHEAKSRSLAGRIRKRVGSQMQKNHGKREKFSRK
ncbi:unnamed protein product [Linum tenue]|uniref:C2H2-type domain-containing protein n=1 Tax=Linum tenue TaxID=586396 RepID=A0AAV0KZF6_9ROSI|nr:unnamed protein product [Linum tenue]